MNFTYTLIKDTISYEIDFYITRLVIINNVSGGTINRHVNQPTI